MEAPPVRVAISESECYTDGSLPLVERPSQSCVHHHFYFYALLPLYYETLYPWTDKSRSRSTVVVPWPSNTVSVLPWFCVSVTLEA